MITGIDHVGIAVSSIEEAKKLYRDILGFEVSATQSSPGSPNRIAWVDTGNARIELLEPADPNAEMARFINRRGEGLHHLSLQVKDIEAEVKKLKERGARITNETPKKSPSGRIVTMDVEGTRGVSIVLVEH